MRFLTVLALVGAFFFSAAAQAGPLDTPEEVGRLLTDGSLLNRIGAVSNQVEAKA
ncbi:MAG: hypothetical protein HXX19_17155, partial [Rhodoferax sp.]|nr:hypothetical protein [Rhodoferax sp.]